LASIFHLPKKQKARWPWGVSGLNGYECCFISEARPRRHAMCMVMMAVVVMKKHHAKEG
jgi:hypothetical protein